MDDYQPTSPAGNALDGGDVMTTTLLASIAVAGYCALPVLGGWWAVRSDGHHRQQGSRTQSRAVVFSVNNRAGDGRTRRAEVERVANAPSARPFQPPAGVGRPGTLAPTPAGIQRRSGVA